MYVLNSCGLVGPRLSKALQEDSKVRLKAPWKSRSDADPNTSATAGSAGKNHLAGTPTMTERPGGLFPGRRFCLCLFFPIKYVLILNLQEYVLQWPSEIMAQ